MIYNLQITDKNENVLDYSNNFETGFSVHTKLSESLDNGSISIDLIDREEGFDVGDLVQITVKGETTTKTFDFRISGDVVTLRTRRPSLYKHEISLIEPIKVLEREIVNGFKVTQPTDGSFTYTLYDVAERLRKTVPLEKNDLLDTTRLFNITSETETILDSIVSPEFTWNNYTLRQCLDEICALVDGVAKLDGRNNFTIQFYNETFDFIGNIDDEFNDKRRSQDIEFYATNMNITAVNLINDNEEAQNVEIYPANGYTTIRSNDYYVDFLKSFIPTPKKIYQTQKLFHLEDITLELTSFFYPSAYIESATSLYPLDLSSRLVEKQLFKTLDVYHDFKGTYADETTLLASYPNGIATPTDRQGYTAFIESTNTTWQYDVNANAWGDTGLLEPLTQLSALNYEQYKPNIDINDTFGQFDIQTILDNVIEKCNFVELSTIPETMVTEVGLGNWIDVNGNLVDPRYIGEFATFGDLPSGGTLIDENFAYVVDEDTYRQYASGSWTDLGDTVSNPYDIGFVVTPTYISGNAREDYLFQVQYIPLQDDMVIDVERDDVSNVFYKLSLLSNQRARIIDFNDLTQRAKGKINRIGNDDLSYSHQVKDVSELYKDGDFTNNNYIISESEYIFFKDYIIGKYRLTKNFNRVSKFIGVNSEVRQWEVSTGENTQTRNFKYKDYCIVDIHNESTSVGSNNGKALMESGKNTILETIYSPTTLNPVRGGYIVEPYDNNVLYIDVSSNASKANMLVFNYKTKDNIVVGDRVVTKGAPIVDSVRQDAIEGVPYTDGYGRMSELNSYLITGLTDKTTLEDFILQGRDLPLIDPLYTPVNRQVVDLSDFPIEKDGGEVLKFTYQVDFFTRDNKVIIGEQWLKRNRLVSENVLDNDGMQIYLYNDLKMSNKYKSKAPTPDSSVTVNGVSLGTTIQEGWITVDETNNRYLFTFQELDGYASWALVDSLGRTILAVNQDNKDAYYNMTFEFEHFREGVQTVITYKAFDFDLEVNTSVTFDYTHKPFRNVIDNFDGFVNTTVDFTYEHQPTPDIQGTFNGVVNTSLAMSYNVTKFKGVVDTFSGTVGSSLSLTYDVAKFKSVTDTFNGTVNSSLGFTYDTCWDECSFDVVDSFFSSTDVSSNEGATCGNNVEKTVCVFQGGGQWLCTEYVGVVTTKCAVQE